MTPLATSSRSNVCSSYSHLTLLPAGWCAVYCPRSSSILLLKSLLHRLVDLYENRLGVHEGIASYSLDLIHVKIKHDFILLSHVA